MFCLTGNDVMTNNQQLLLDDTVVLRQAPSPPFNRTNNFDTVQFEKVRDDNEFLIFEPERDDDFNFEKIHEEFGRPIMQALRDRKVLKEKAEMPLIFL